MTRGPETRQKIVVCKGVAGCGVYCCNLADVGATDSICMTARKEKGGAALSAGAGANATRRAFGRSEIKSWRCEVMYSEPERWMVSMDV
jgi:hypothetical protein